MGNEVKYIGIVNKNGEFLSRFTMSGINDYEAKWDDLLRWALLLSVEVAGIHPQYLEQYKGVAEIVGGRLVEVEATFTARDMETRETLEISGALNRVIGGY